MAASILIRGPVLPKSCLSRLTQHSPLCSVWQNLSFADVESSLDVLVPDILVETVTGPQCAGCEGSN